MKQYLPSKRFLVITVSLLALLLLAIGIDYANNQRAKKKALLIAESPTLAEIVSGDSDGDGVPDWQEVLFGTDPQKKDTNDDGISDFDEIQNKKSELNQSNGDFNETTIFSRELFSTLISLESTGNLNTNAVQNLSDTVSGSLSEEDISDVYEIRQIKTTSGSVSSIKNYYKKMSDLRSKFLSRGIGQEIDIWDKNIESNADISADLYSIADVYIEYSKELMALSVPPEITNLHLATANTHYKMGVAVRDMALYDTNPIQSLSGFARYQAYIEFLGEINTGFETYFSKYDIL